MAHLCRRGGELEIPNAAQPGTQRPYHVLAARARGGRIEFHQRIGVLPRHARGLRRLARSGESRAGAGTRCIPTLRRPSDGRSSGRAPTGGALDVKDVTPFCTRWAAQWLAAAAELGAPGDRRLQRRRNPRAGLLSGDHPQRRRRQPPMRSCARRCGAATSNWKRAPGSASSVCEGRAHHGVEDGAPTAVASRERQSRSDRVRGSGQFAATAAAVGDRAGGHALRSRHFSAPRQSRASAGTCRITSAVVVLLSRPRVRRSMTNCTRVGPNASRACAMC